ncbi:HNH endonuclease signature motif containing protein [Georgenia alba]|uniref:DUF222 domain-containing protein n=1 Tax=Georgenia alba TaxID=2233858 RepID=A0ABW2QBH0_9MICO
MDRSALVVADSGYCCAVESAGGVCGHARALVAELDREVCEAEIRCLLDSDVEGLFGGDAGGLFGEDAETTQGAGTGRVSSAEAAAPAEGRFDVDGDVDGDAVRLGLTVAELAVMEPGPELAAVLAGVDVAGLSRAGQVEVLAAAKRLEAWAAGKAAATAGALSRGSELFTHPEQVARVAGRVVNPTVEEVAMRLAVSRAEAGMLVRVGRGLAGSFTDTADALDSGLVDFRKAAAIVTGLDGSPTEVAWMVEQDVLPQAPGLPAAEITRRVADRVVRVDPVEAAARHARARAGRHVTHTRVLPDGMGSLTAVLPAEDCVLVDQTLTTVAAAARNGGDGRSVDQLRADALVALTRAGILTGATGPHADPETIPALRDTSQVLSVQGVLPGLDARPEADHPDSTDDAKTPSTAPGPGAAREPNGADAGSAESSGAKDGLRSVDVDTGGVGRWGRRKRQTIQGRFPDLPHGRVPEVAVISPLLAALLRHHDDLEDLPVARPRINVTVPIDLLAQAHAALAGETPLGDLGTALPGAPGSSLSTDEKTAPSGEAGRSLPGDPETTTRAADTALPSSVGRALPTGEGTALPGAGTAVGGAEAAVPFEDAAGPVGTLGGYGALNPAQTLALAAGGTWRRLLTDPATGTVLDVGRTRYRPPAGLAEHVRLRDRTCHRPGCTVDAEHCELDHTIARSAHGATAAANLGPLCGRDHALKTVGAMRVTQPTPGLFQWVTPSGHTYRRDTTGTLTFLGLTTPPQQPGETETDDYGDPPF